MFRGVLIAMALTSMAVEAINLTIIWGLSVIVDGVTTQGVELFVESRFWLLAVLAFLIFPVMPVFFYITNILNSHTIGISLPVAIQWQGHMAVERQDLAFFHDLFAGQVASRLSQVANAAQQQILIGFQTVPRFLLQIVGSVFLLFALSWQLALPVLIWLVLNVVFTIKVVPDFTERSRRSAKHNSLISGALTDLYGNIQMVKQFAAEDSEAGALRKIMSNAVRTLHYEQRIYRTTELVVISLNMLLWLVMLSIGFVGLYDKFLTVGDFVATVYILQRLSAGSFTFLQMGQQVFKALGTIKDAMPVMTTPPTIRDRPDATELFVRHGEIRFEGVDFAYKSGRPVIDDLSLRVRPGEKIGCDLRPLAIRVTNGVRRVGGEPFRIALVVDQIKLAVDDLECFWIGIDRDRSVRYLARAVAAILRRIFQRFTHEHFAVFGIGEMPWRSQPFVGEFLGAFHRFAFGEIGDCIISHDRYAAEVPRVYRVVGKSRRSADSRCYSQTDHRHRATNPLCTAFGPYIHLCLLFNRGFPCTSHNLGRPGSWPEDRSRHAA